MTLINTRPVTPGQKHRTKLDLRFLTKKEPEKKLIKMLKRHAGRNSSGKITVRHHGNGARQQYRIIDFKRDKREMNGKVVALEYDPNRTCHIALIQYQDGVKRYILCPEGLSVGQEVIASETAKIKTGNALPIDQIPVGTPIHNIELTPGKGGQIVRSAGAQAFIQAKEGVYAQVLLPSGELRQISLHSWASVGQVSNADWKNISLGKAGRKRHSGWRPSVRGVAMHPNAHPHGGGEGRSGIGMPSPKSPWGKKTLGKKTRKLTKPGTRFIIKDRGIK